jgi:hypothetical protein
MTTPTVKPDIAEITINEEQKLYVIPCGDGYTTAGFQYVADQVTQMLPFVPGAVAPGPEHFGTLAMYQFYRDLIKYISDNRINLPTWYSIHTDEKVKTVLDRLIQGKGIVRIWYGNTDPEKPGYGRPWPEENDVYGRIGRSSGIFKIPLLVVPGDHGGGGVLDRFVIRIMTNTGMELYRHPSYWERDYEIKPCDVNGLKAAVHIDGSGDPHARFKNKEAAARWVGFMKGERMRP